MLDLKISITNIAKRVNKIIKNKSEIAIKKRMIKI